MRKCFFVSDLHGIEQRYNKLFQTIWSEKPKAVFFGGDLLPHVLKELLVESRYPDGDFVRDFIRNHLLLLKKQLGHDYPRMFFILGNDDIRIEEQKFFDLQTEGLCEYINEKVVMFAEYSIFGYAYVPPTPFLLKDWEKYDVSRYVDPSCISPLKGHRTVAIEQSKIKFGTIQKDLQQLTRKKNLKKAIFLFHSPPYQTKLDRAALDGKTIDHVPLDVHCGSIAIKRFIEDKEPLLTLHGHIHESTRLTGTWQDQIGKTKCFSAAHDGKELSIVKFDLDHLSEANRVLI